MPPPPRSNVVPGYGMHLFDKTILPSLELRGGKSLPDDMTDPGEKAVFQMKPVKYPGYGNSTIVRNRKNKSISAPAPKGHTDHCSTE